MNLKFNEFIDEDINASTTREPRSKYPTSRYESASAYHDKDQNTSRLSKRSATKLDKNFADISKIANKPELEDSYRDDDHLEIETKPLISQEQESNVVLIIRILKVAIPNILSNFVFYL